MQTIMVYELQLKKPGSALFDSLVQLYIDAKREMQRSAPDPADLLIRKYFGHAAGKILDVGCGAGDEAIVYEKLGFAAVYGIDPSRRMLERAIAKVAHPINFRQAYIERTGFTDQFFDAVVGTYSFHYLEDLDAGYRELARILKPGGLLLLSVRHPFSDLREPDRFSKNGRNYVRALVYERVPIEHPMHSIKEYFSPAFVNLFDLVEVQEWGKPNKVDEDPSPFLLGYAARRRGT